MSQDVLIPLAAGIVIGYVIGQLVATVLMFLFYDQIMGSLDRIYARLPWNRHAS